MLTLGAAPVAARIDTRFGAVECAVQGPGRALLALHGGMGGYDQSWLLARAVAGSRAGRVIAVSRPGYLGTALELGGTAQQQADILAAPRTVERHHIRGSVAVSAGGPAALHFAAQHPQRCRSLILVSTCTSVLETPPKVLRRMRIFALFARVPGLLPWLRRKVARRPDAAAARAIPDPALRARTLADPEAGPLLQALQRSVFDRLPQRLPGTVNDIAQFGQLAPIPFDRIAAPTLVVHGMADDIVPVSHARLAAERIPGAALLALEGAGHVALFTHLDAIRRRAAPFLDRP